VPELHLDLRRARSHRVDAELRVQPTSTRVGLALPRWTPGSYLLREYVGQLEGLLITQQGRPLSPRRITPFRWELDLDQLEQLVIRYTLQATELTVRTAHVNGDHGFLPLAAIALQVDGQRWTSHRLTLALPEGWDAFVPLPQQADGSWLANSFDALIDSPVETGPHCAHSFSVAGVPHRWVGWGGDLPAQDPAWLTDVERVCLACCRLMGVPRPAADDYLFVLHLTEQGYGGLEHDNSTVLQFGRRRLRSDDGRRRLLQLVAHEYLHQWNVRRLRPAPLAPIDYDRAVVIPTLWFAEGVTSYVDQLLPHAAGCCASEVVLADLAEDLSRYKASQGRLVQSLRCSSEEAWVKLYRPHAHAANQQISYYLKGAVLALVLDLRLRQRGSWIGAVLQQLWASHGRPRRGYSESDLLQAFASHDQELETLLPHWLGSTDDPPIEPMLATVGLQLTPVPGSKPVAGWQLEQRPSGGVWIQRIQRDAQAQMAGLDVGDELIAAQGERLRTLDDVDHLLNEALNAAGTGADPCCELLICRDGLLRQLTLRLAAPEPERWILQPDPQADASCEQRREAWLQLRP